MLSAMAQFLSSVVKSDSANDYYTLGIDVGTTSIKTVIVHSVAASAPATPASHSSSPSSPPIPSSPSPSFSHRILSWHGSEHEATLPASPSAPLNSEQDTSKLLLAICASIRSLPAEHRRKVEYVGVSCQMHGVVLWNDRLSTPFVTALLTAAPAAALPPCPHSHFVDWRDGRCSAEFLSKLNASLPSPPFTSPLQSGPVLCTGYAIATLAHIAQTSPSQLTAYTRAGSIGDYFVWLLMNTRDSSSASAALYPAYIHPSNAAAWGCYEQDKHAWQTDRSAAFRIPSSLLPTVLTTSPLFPLTPVMVQLLGLSPQAHTAVSVGDAQASVWAVQPERHQMVFYVGTSAQISIVMDDDSKQQQNDDDHEDEGAERQRDHSLSIATSLNARAEGEERPSALRDAAAGVDFVLPSPPSAATSTPPPPLPSCEYRPYLDGRQLLVCASLNGGNTVDWLARSLQLTHAALASPSPLSPSSLSHAAAPSSSASSSSASSPPSSGPRAVQPLSYYYTLMLQQGYEHVPFPPLLTFCPTLIPERHSSAAAPSQASLSFLSSSLLALSPGSLVSALCLGVVRNVKSMLERSAGTRGRRRMQGITELVAVGGALRRNALLRLYAEKEWQRRLVMAKKMTCDWKRAEVEKANADRAKVRRGSKGGAVQQLDTSEAAEEEGSEDPSVYHPDAAFGVAVFGLERMQQRRARELLAAKAMRLL